MDLLQQAKDAFKDAQEEMREQHARMREDLQFSNPSDPKQWDLEALSARKGRPCLTFDRTNQFIMQVVNDARRNKPAIKVLPANSQADDDVAKKLNGIVKHIEYVSRAGAAYDTAIESAARVGLGWMRVIPELMRPETNEQEVRILRVHDPMSVLLEAGWTEPDGSDAMCGLAMSLMSKAGFERAYPKGKADNFDEEGWFSEDSVRVAEFFKIIEKKQNNIVAMLQGGQQAMPEDKFWEAHKMGEAIMLPDENGAPQTFESKQRTQKWAKVSGCEILEETDFPSQYIPLVPVMGYEIWIEGKRYLCGMTRRLMDGQRAYNYERSAFIESVAMQPKAPFLVPVEGIENVENDWKRLNTGNPAYLPFNAWTEDGKQLPTPQRLAPPTLPMAFANGGQIASADMESAVGMHKANLGQQGNETSGKAIRARQQEGDTANFHYIDNQARAIEQLGRIVVDMIPRLYDTQRQARIVGEDGSHDFVQVDPQMRQPLQRQGKKITAINPTIGAYDVRVEVGPSFASLQEEAAQNIVDISQGNPQLGAAMAPMLMKFRNMPEADKMARVAMALLPPQVQKAYGEDESEELPPEAQAQIDAMGQEIEALKAQLQEASQAADEVQHSKAVDEGKLMVDAYKAETDRISAIAPAITPEQVQALVMQTLEQALSQPLPGMEGQQAPQVPQGEPMPMQPPPQAAPPQAMPPQAPPQQPV